MSAGAIFVNTGLSEISTMGGLVKKMPVTSVCFTAASLGIAGLPLMAGFVSKFNILEGALMVSKPFAMVVLVAAAILALSYLMPVVRIFFGKETSVVSENGHHVSKYAVTAMVVPLALTAVIAIILGFVPNAGPHLYDMAQMAAEAITEEGGVYLAG